MIVIRNANIFDGTGAPRFMGEIAIEGDKIVEVTRRGEVSRSSGGARDNARASGGALITDGGGARVADAGSARIIDADGATLMPGLVEAHAHLTWPSSVEKLVPGMHLPPEELALTAARNARILLDHGYTSAYSAGALSKKLEVFLKEQIDSGGLPGPRLIPSSIEREPPNEDETLAVGRQAEHGRGPEAVRAFVRECASMGAKAVKFLISGESALKPGASHELLYSEEELRAAGEQARESGVWLTGHAHAAEAVKLGVRSGFRVLYHCTYADEQAIDLLASRREEMFVAPSVGIVQATLDARPPPGFDMSHMKADAEVVLARQKQVVPELKRRGMRILPGGDYGFPFNPTGRNARDLELFVRHFGFTPIETLVAATKLGGEIMGMGGELGQVKPGYLADLLLVKGDPTLDVTVLQNKDNLLAIMKDGRFHKAPGHA